MTTTNVLKGRVETFARRLLETHPLMDRARAGQVQPHTVVAYIASIRHLLRHTPIHLEAAMSRAASLGDTALAGYLERKIGEEAGHAEWAEHDLEHMIPLCDGPVAPCQAVVRLMDYVSTVVERAPSHYLGYILLAEYFTVLAGPKWVAELTARCGVPADALTAISKHVELDQAHVAEGLEEFGTLLRTNEARDGSLAVLAIGMQEYESMFDELLLLETKASPPRRNSAQ